MAYESNKAVERLQQYIPFQPAHANLYEEYVEHGVSAPRVETKALTFVRSLLAGAEARLIVLTGDAGHGKTHICRRLLDDIGGDPSVSLEWLRAHGDGAIPFESRNAGLPSLRVVKDLSELGVRRGLEALRSGLEGSGPPLLACANEGVLRDVVAFSDGALDILRTTLEQSIRSGVTSVSAGVHVINLNYQSVGSPDCTTLSEILKGWVHASRWQTCKRCDAAERCPILANRNELAGSAGTEDDAKQRRDAIRLLLQVVEESGQVVTFRELLIFVAYLITGGLTCRDVEGRCRARREDDWQFAFSYPQLAFDPGLSPDQKRRLPLFEALARLDPGRQAVRLIDEPLAAESIEVGGTFRPAHRDAPENGTRSRRAALEAAERFQDRVTFLRRRDYFDLATDHADGPADSKRETSWARRLGLRHYEDFDFLRGDPGIDLNRYIQLRDRLICGLHAVQGVHVSASRVLSLHLVDPAFTRDQKAATIVARQVRATDVSIQPESRAWARGTATVPQLPLAVDWLDRRLVVRFGESYRAELVLDLLQFEYVLRAADGLSCRAFFRADIRRVMAVLARLVEEFAGESPDIHVLKSGKLRTIVIDHGMIRAGDN